MSVTLPSDSFGDSKVLVIVEMNLCWVHTLPTHIEVIYLKILPEVKTNVADYSEIEISTALLNLVLGHASLISIWKHVGNTDLKKNGIPQVRESSSFHT